MKDHKAMGLFSRPKCPIHRTEYSIGSNGLTDYYFCKHCRSKAQKEHKDKQSKDEEITAEEILEMEVPLKIGDVVKVWDGNEENFIIGVLTNIGEGGFPYQVSGFDLFKNAKKVTKEEVLELLGL